MPEMIDIYDENRVFTGEKLSRKSKLNPGQYMLYVYACIRNKDGRILVTRRSLDKKWAAGKWEVPGGGVLAGEDSRTAINREIMEETGLNVSDCQAKVALTYRNDDKAGDNYFADVYIIDKDFTVDDLSVQPEEVIDVKLATIDEIKALYDTQGFLHYERIIKALGE